MGGTASPGEVLWTWQTSDIVLGICSVGATLIYLDFMLIPLTMAYFTTFTMLPVLEALEKRPYLGRCSETAPWTKMMPVVDEEASEAAGETVYQIDEETRNPILVRKSNPGDDAFFQMEEDASGAPVLDSDGKPVRKKDDYGKDVKIHNVFIKECVMLGKVPHGIACILTLIISFGILAVLLGIVVSNFSAFAANEEAKAAEGQPTIGDDMCRLGNDIIAQLERDGVSILRPRTCTARNISSTKVWSDIQDTRTVASELFDGVDIVNDDDLCIPMNIEGRELNVRTYSKQKFKCQQDWEQVVAQAGPWCAMDQITIGAVDACVQNPDTSCDTEAPSQGLQSVWDAPDLRLFYSCVDKMIGANTLRTTITHPFLLDLPAERQVAVPSNLDLDGLTGDVDPFNAVTGCDSNSTIPFGECVDSVRETFIRNLAGLSEAKRNLPTDDYVTSSCVDFNEDTDFKGFCNAADAASCDSTMDVVADLLDTECSDKDAQQCEDADQCRYTAAGTAADGTVVNENCGLAPFLMTNETGLHGLSMGHFCPDTCTGTNKADACPVQLLWAKNHYLAQLEKLRMDNPPVSYTLGIKIDNFYDEMMDVPEENCTSIDLFCSPNLLDEYGQEMVGTPWGDLVETVGAVGALVSDVVLVLLLAVYILMERPMEEPESRVVLEIEAMIKNYINLKIILSFMTGVFVALFLTFCGVQLAMVFGLLAFMLNFVPCVGSLIATLLPIPLIILDDGLSESEKLVAFLGPTSVQLYVGNVLEPGLFGKSLNMTEIAVLNALVLAQLVWGLCGAVLSVPMLGIMKIVCHHTDHPIAKYTLAMVRADAAYP
eukprot:COSAG02_NODE_842_length_16609_cov_117.586675_5_plen_828_part_00